jgi:hypothetical protein
VAPATPFVSPKTLRIRARRDPFRIVAAQRARPITWTAFSLLVLTGFYNVTGMGPLLSAMESGAGLALAAKFFLVILAGRWRASGISASSDAWPAALGPETIRPAP